MNSKSWPYKPNTVQIEAVQGCNRHCSFCGTAGIDPTIRRADVKTIFHTCKLIKDAGLNCRILLAGHGEPTLHPEIVNIVRTIRPGLLPDARGQLTLKKPTEEDRKTVINTRPSLAIMVRRKWERSER